MMGKKLQILILDDEPIVGKRLGPALAKMDAEVEVYEDPFKALQRIEEKTFDIVVTDIRMEGLDGIEILEKVRAKSGQTKVIMITGYATVEVAHEALAKGAFDFIAKPFKPDDLREVIRRAVEPSGSKEIPRSASLKEK